MDLCEVAIVGGGPVGLFLAARLRQLGVDCTVLERRASPTGQTRAIGIHPPSLEFLAEMGLADALVARGLAVRIGRAFSGSRCLGSLRFYQCPPPFNFVLTAPQHETEHVFDRHLQRVSPGMVRAGSEVVGMEQGVGDVVLRYRNGEARELRAKFVVGCDGKDSAVRRQLGVSFAGKPYGDSFVMGDFADGTSFGDEARIFMDDQGFIESFPLPGLQRRWVVRTPRFFDQPNPDDFCARVRDRTGADLAGYLRSPLTPFGVQRYVASHFAGGRLALAGDAAHVMTPFGGQGLNTGWMDAWDLAETLRSVLRDGRSHGTALHHYSQHARRRACRAIRRAHLNLAIGRTHAFGLRSLFVSAALRLPIQRRLARYFTMRGL